MNIFGFDPLTCIQLYKAFVRPGLEYGFRLLGNLSSTMKKLRLAQKCGLCAILGVDLNSRIEIIDAFTGFLSFSVCQALVCVRSHLCHSRSPRWRWVSSPVRTTRSPWPSWLLPSGILNTSAPHWIHLRSWRHTLSRLRTWSILKTSEDPPRYQTFSLFLFIFAIVDIFIISNSSIKMNILT